MDGCFYVDKWLRFRGLLDPTIVQMVVTMMVQCDGASSIVLGCSDAAEGVE